VSWLPPSVVVIPHELLPPSPPPAHTSFASLPLVPHFYNKHRWAAFSLLCQLADPSYCSAISVLLHLKTFSFCVNLIFFLLQPACACTQPQLASLVSRIGNSSPLNCPWITESLLFLRPPSTRFPILFCPYALCQSQLYSTSTKQLRCVSTTTF